MFGYLPTTNRIESSEKTGLLLRLLSDNCQFIFTSVPFTILRRGHRRNECYSLPDAGQTQLLSNFAVFRQKTLFARRIERTVNTTCRDVCSHADSGN